MRVVIQRVSRASVSVSGEVISSIGRGLCVLVGIHKDDVGADMDYMVRKVLNTRLFEGSTGKRWDLGVKDAGFEVLCISQFTLYCDLKGNKPDYRLAMGGDGAKAFYEKFINKLKENYDPKQIKDGIFGAMMDVSVTNDGPVTITLDSPAKKGNDELS